MRCIAFADGRCRAGGAIAASGDIEHGSRPDRNASRVKADITFACATLLPWVFAEAFYREVDKSCFSRPVAAEGCYAS